MVSLEFLVPCAVIAIGIFIKILSKVDDPSPTDMAIGPTSALSALMLVLNNLAEVGKSKSTPFVYNSVAEILALILTIFICVLMAREVDKLKKENDMKKELKKGVVIWLYSIVSFLLGAASVIYAVVVKSAV